MMVGMGFGLIGLLITLLLLGGVIVGGVWLARMAFHSSSRQTSPSHREPSQNPREILDRRYASGEITSEEYQAMKHDLES
jgi:putative membrane protein